MRRRRRGRFGGSGGLGNQTIVGCPFLKGYYAQVQDMTEMCVVVAAVSSGV
jgi:hypothetical protein